MKVTPKAADGFVKRPDPAARAILVYGPDDGLVSERAKLLVRTVCPNLDDPFQLVQYTGAQLAADPARLTDEAREFSMMGRRVIWLRDVGNGQTAAFEQLLGDDKAEALVVAEAGDLNAKSSLRKLFEEARNAAALPCYADDNEAIAEVARSMLAEAGLKADGEALGYLVDHLGGDRLLTRRELEKLISYKGSGPATVTIEDCEAVVGDSAVTGLDDVVYATASGNFTGLDRALARVFLEGDPPVAVLRVAQKHFQKLHQAVASGGDARAMTKRLGVFYKREAEFVAQATRWTAPRLATALDLLTQAEIDCKSSNMPDEAICRHALLRIATAARSGRR